MSEKLFKDLNEWRHKVLMAVEAQANDETLWTTRLDGTVSIGEAYMQQSLRWLHRVIEENDPTALRSIVDQSNGDV